MYTSDAEELRDSMENLKKKMNDIKHLNLEDRSAKSIAEMVDTFARESAKQNYIPVSVFKKYEPLFDVELRKKALANQMQVDESEHYARLSQEFSRLVNMYEPIHIVDDRTGEEIMPPLPAIFTRLNFLSGKARNTMDSFTTAHMLDDGTNAGISDRNKKISSVDLSNAIQDTQNTSDLFKQVAEFDKMAARVEHPERFQPSKPVETKPVAPSSDSGLDFEPIPDDE